MLALQTRRVVGRLLYSIKADSLGDDLVDRRAHALIMEPIEKLSATEEYQAITEALASDATLSTVIPLPDFITTAPTEEQFRDFLRRLVLRLDEMRPWPVPPHHGMDISGWPDAYSGAGPSCRIKMRSVEAQEHINYVFRGVDDDTHGRREVLVLRLRSGDEIALVTPWWPGSDHVAVLSHDPSRGADDVRAALVDGTDFELGDIDVLPAEGEQA